MRRVEAGDFPRFRARATWWTRDLQTLRNTIRPPRVDFGESSESELKLPLADGSGDVVVCTLQRPQAERGPLVVLIHGLAGSSESSYVRATAAFLLAKRYRVLRINLRGAGASRPLCREQYHAGRSDDLRDVLRGLEAHSGRGLFLVGFSLGGNMLLKFLAEHGEAFPVRAAVSVSAPIDLHASVRRIMSRRNFIYHRTLLSGMKREALAAEVLLADEAAAVRTARSIFEFDDLIVAPRNGYEGALAYYADNMALRFLDRIQVPTLLIHALDDPWIPATPYTDYAWPRNRNLLPLLPHRGGHVGFHGAGSRVPWHDQCIAAFLRPE